MCVFIKIMSVFIKIWARKLKIKNKHPLKVVYQPWLTKQKPASTNCDWVFVHSSMNSSAENLNSSKSTHLNHDVFLSYNSQDTLKHFTGHLYTALDQAGIRTFSVYNNDELEIGSDMLVESIKAIGESKASIIVFSKNYVSSNRCRNEFEKIVECERMFKQLVVAVYYDVSPIYVRKQIERFGGCFDATNVSEWDLNVILDG